ncbi:SDR family oxidoreductase [Nannocystis exedens]|uniref:SDR family oxidoreductase n=1 Tax=Nannocystis exedens TaxID=54 RepID=UPI000BBA0B46|nr:SDR family oxidoreductase [Nannocystis exedens]PCC74946.1 3-beta hydroxysteroid dehydrogenase [Nannocystis exedens]
MKIFVTGATGMIGTGVVAELRGAGHRVLGLARSEAAAAALARMGAEVHAGDLTKPDTLVEGARACDGAIHLGFVMDFQDLPGAFATDRRAIEALGSAFAGSRRPLVFTTGTLVLPAGRIGTEDDDGDLAASAGFRVPAENLALAWADRGVHVSVVRPAPTVHGPRDHHGFMPMLIAAARKAGSSGYVGDGSNRWPAVHHDDCARVYRLALERAAERARYHAVGEEGVAMRQVAEAIGRRLGVPAVSLSPAEAEARFGPFLGPLVASDNPVSTALTRQRLDWAPAHPGLIADLEAAHCYARN